MLELTQKHLKGGPWNAGNPPSQKPTFPFRAGGGLGPSEPEVKDSFPSWRRAGTPPRAESQNSLPRAGDGLGTPDPKVEWSSRAGGGLAARVTGTLSGLLFGLLLGVGLVRAHARGDIFNCWLRGQAIQALLQATDPQQVTQQKVKLRDPELFGKGRGSTNIVHWRNGRLFSGLHGIVGSRGRAAMRR